MADVIEMRIVVFSLIDDWNIGALLTGRGHQIAAWIRPQWEPTDRVSPRFRGLRRIAKLALSQDRPIGHVVPEFDVQEHLRKLGVPMVACTNVNDPAFVENLRKLQIDLIVVAVYPQILRSPLLNVARLGVINYHPSLLPRYAGPQPTFWALRNGEKETGITIHRMTEKIDAGEILNQEVVAIGDRENLGQLMQRLHHRAASVITETVDAIDSGGIEPRPQDSAARTYFGRKKRKDTVIDWNQSSRSLANLLRAVQPYEPLVTVLRGRVLKVYDAEPVDVGTAGIAGEVLQKGPGHFVVRTGGGGLRVTQFEISPYHGWMNRWMQRFVPAIGDRFVLSTEEPPAETNA